VTNDVGENRFADEGTLRDIIRLGKRGRLRQRRYWLIGEGAQAMQ
jgi:hypothetical protein